MADSRIERAHDFLLREGRLLERRRFATEFEGAPPQGVVDALLGYRNPDGGFGHGLEPDKRSPHSQPLDVQLAFETIVRSRALGPAVLEVVLAACDFLASVAASDGNVALVLPGVGDFPHAPHVTEDAFPPGLNPTAMLAGLLHELQVAHPWRDRATATTFASLEHEGVPAEAHTIHAVLCFLEHVDDRARADALVSRVAEVLPDAAYLRWNADDPEYGVALTELAPSPDCPWRALFDSAGFDAHLDRLERDQQADGGWPITWPAISDATRLEYRSIRTLDALHVLTAYGRL
ncbi:MAG: hypothetical protein ACHQDE_00310 [Acidimicrobiia bacterium]